MRSESDNEARCARGHEPCASRLRRCPPEAMANPLLCGRRSGMRNEQPASGVIAPIEPALVVSNHEQGVGVLVDCLFTRESLGANGANAVHVCCGDSSRVRISDSATFGSSLHLDIRNIGDAGATGREVPSNNRHPRSQRFTPQRRPLTLASGVWCVGAGSGALWGGEERRIRGGARSALPTSDSLRMSERSACRARSEFAARPGSEHRNGVDPQGRPTRRAPDPAPTHHTPRHSKPSPK